MLEGRLVRLRPLQMEDLDRYVTWFNDPEVRRYLAARYPMGKAAEADWLEARAKTPTGLENLTFAVESLDDRCHIGSVAFHEVRPEDRKATFGIMIGDRKFWDRGFGTDATRTLLRFGFDEINLHRV